jgi:hypothetical protein
MTWILIAIAIFLILWKLGVIEFGFFTLSPRNHEIDEPQDKPGNDR